MQNGYLDEGYIKYQCEWELAPPLPYELLSELNRWRSHMYDLRLIGYYPHLGVGYGNISYRCPGQYGHFIISGTQTGHIGRLTDMQYTAISGYDIDANSLHCKGPVKASSESLTHAAVYELSTRYQAVIHIHHFDMWKALLGKIPTTAEEVPYGTPEMAGEVARLYRESDLAVKRIFAMAGHEEGIIAFGESLEAAADVIIDHLHISQQS